MGLNAYQVTTYRYDGRLWVQAGAAQLTISDNGTVDITVWQQRISAQEAARLRDRITAALAALEAGLDPGQHRPHYRRPAGSRKDPG